MGPGSSRDLGDVVGEGRVDAVGTHGCAPGLRCRGLRWPGVGPGGSWVRDPALHGRLGSPAPLSSISGVAVDIWLSHLGRKVYCNQCEDSSSPLPRAGPRAGTFKAVRQRARPISCLDSCLQHLPCLFLLRIWAKRGKNCTSIEVLLVDH